MVILTSGQVFTPKQIQGGSILWRRRLLLSVRLNAVLQSSYDLLNNYKVLIIIETFNCHWDAIKAQCCYF